MSDTVVEEKAGNPKADEWAARIAPQRRSGRSVKQFCKHRGLTECSFYAWRKRLGEKGPGTIALVERRLSRQGLPALHLIARLYAVEERA